MASPVVTYVVNKLGDYIIQEASAFLGVGEDIEWLERELKGMLCFLADADAKGKGDDERVKNWVREIRDVAHEAEDVIDNFLLRVRSHPSRRSPMLKMASCVDLFVSTKARRDTAKKIASLKVRITEISARQGALGIVNLGGSGGLDAAVMRESLQARRRLSPHHYDESSVVGFDAEKKIIVDQLLGEEKRRFVISIVGMGGLGKTTLAKKVFHSNEISHHFKARIWVTVSETYNVLELLKKLLKEVGATTNNENGDEEELKSNLCEALKMRGPYLVVMDDVWKKEVWRRIETALPDIGNGSRVIFTTRIEDVARSADPAIPPHKLRLLDNEESRLLFLKKAYPYRDVQTFREDLKHVGERLVESCHGLPLALEVLGGLLSTKVEKPDVWSSMLNKVKWQAAEEGKECLDILRLSYEQLPYYLKPCFLYIGAFPEDYDIRINGLIELWIAEGFIPKRLGETRKSTSEDFLHELIQRCMIQEKRYHCGRLTSIGVHDLIRDLCIEEARESGLLTVVSHLADDMPTSSDLTGTRRLAISDRNEDSYVDLSEDMWKMPNLRTLICFTNIKGGGQFLSGLRLLRVIDIAVPSDDMDMVLSKEVKNVINLRCLRYRGTYESQIVISKSSIENLHNLQFVDVYPGLEGSSIRSIEGLTNLVTFKRIGAGRWIESDFSKLLHLESLGIVGVENVHHEMLLGSLGKLSCLRSLSLSAEREHGTIPTEVLAIFSRHRHLCRIYLGGLLSKKQQLPPCNQFAPNLGHLFLFSSKLEQDPLVVLEKLPNLVLLFMRDTYVGRKMFCSSGGFPALQEMYIENLEALEEWTMEPGAMPSLIKLSIWNVRTLNMLPEGLRSVTTISHLDLSGISDELLRRVQRDHGEDWHKIQHIPHLDIPSIIYENGDDEIDEE